MQEWQDFPRKIRDLNTGSTGDVGTDDITAIVSFIKTKNFRIGSALPVMMGISFAYVPSMQAIASDFDIATILGAQIIGGVVALLVGLNIKRIRKFFPPLITGTVVFSIGLSLYPTAINYMAGGASSKTYGSWQNWVVAIITLIIVTALNHYGKGYGNWHPS